MNHPSAKIIYVEDKLDTAEIVKIYLERAGYSVSHYTTKKSGLNALQNLRFDLAIFDLILPDGNGIALLKYAVTNQIPSILLSAKKSESERIEGFQYGADDYVCKPFSPQELTYRVKALLNRIQKTNVSHILHFQGLQIDHEQQKVLLNKSPISLTGLEFAILFALASHPNKVFSRNMLMEKIWENTPGITDRAIDTHIANLRKKLNDERHAPKWIRTIYGQGYQFMAPLVDETPN